MVGGEENKARNTLHKYKYTDECMIHVLLTVTHPIFSPFAESRTFHLWHPRFLLVLEFLP